ncbi:hypothetical protein QJS63_15255 [Pseudomonas juntendi]|nr:hypothetical protein QJS63_15255 [Pseudomonas juntendi]
MSETNETIASLRSSIEVLHSLAVTLQMQISSKAESSFVAELASRVTACEGRVAACGSQVAAQGASIAAQGRAVTALTNTITHETSSRVGADDALATHIGVLSCNLQDNRAAASATSFLTTRVTTAEDPKPEYSSSKPVESLSLGGVTFCGESARAIRDVQEVLREVGAGQLEVVKRESEGDSPFVVIDGQVFIAEATVESAVIDPARFNIRLDATEQGIPIATGFSLCVDFRASV